MLMLPAIRHRYACRRHASACRRYRALRQRYKALDKARRAITLREQTRSGGDMPAARSADDEAPHSAVCRARCRASRYAKRFVYADTQAGDHQIMILPPYTMPQYAQPARCAAEGVGKALCKTRLMPRAAAPRDARVTCEARARFFFFCCCCHECALRRCDAVSIESCRCFRRCLPPIDAVYAADTFSAFISPSLAAYAISPLYAFADISLFRRLMMISRYRRASPAMYAADFRRAAAEIRHALMPFIAAMMMPCREAYFAATLTPPPYAMPLR